MFETLNPFEDSIAYCMWLKSLGGGPEAIAIAKHIKKLAKDNGTQTHKVIEDYLNNKEFNTKLPLLIMAHFKNILPLLHNINNISATEIPIYSDSMNLAGTPDCIAEYNGIPSIIDFKTSNKKKQKPQITQFLIQLTAYCIMWEEITSQTIPQIILLLTAADGSLKEIIAKPTDYKDLLFTQLKDYNKIRKTEFIQEPTEAIIIPS